MKVDTKWSNSCVPQECQTVFKQHSAEQLWGVFAPYCSQHQTSPKINCDPLFHWVFRISLPTFVEGNISFSLISLIYLTCRHNICYRFNRLIRVFLLKPTLIHWLDSTNFPNNFTCYSFCVWIFIPTQWSSCAVCSFLTIIHSKKDTLFPSVINDNLICVQLV